LAGPDLIYKVASHELVDAALASGTFTGSPVDLADGFLHFSTAVQLPETLRLHFAGQSDLVLLGIYADALRSSLKWEPSRGGQLFPHLYGGLSMSAVEHSAPIAVAEDGSVTLPAWVR
jgi:uncharacterized protein (DUF952 family)